MAIALLSVSVVLQFLAAVLAFRLVFTSGRWPAWALISSALALMAAHRAFTFYRTVLGEAPAPPDLVAESIAVLIALLMVVGVLLIGPYIKSARRAVAELRDSEKRFRDVAEVAADWIWEMNADLRFTFLSSRFFDLFPIQPEEILGKTREEYCRLGVLGDAWKKHLSDLSNQRPFQDFEYTVQEDGGAHRYIRISGKPIFDGQGNFLGYRGTGTDITERKKAEALNARLGRIIEKSLNEIYTFDATSLCFTDVNSGARQNLGYSQEEIRKLTPIDIKPLYDEQDFKRLVAPLLSGEKEQIVFETVHQRKDGTRYDARIHLQYMPEETPAVFVAIVDDVTERKIAEEKLRRALADAERAGRAKSEFLAVMSHEFRTPLNAILGFSEVLTDRELASAMGDKRVEYAKDIHSSGEHLLELVNDILDLSTIEAGRKRLDKKELAVSDLVADSFKAVERKARDKGLTLLTDVLDDDVVVFADRRAAVQILINLLSNAVKFTPDGGKIVVSAWVSPGHTYVRIADTGTGIPGDKLQRITDPFVKGEGDPHKAVDGWGLGLSITKSLVDLHEGDLHIDSTVGKGTAVTVTLPRKTSEAAGASLAG